MTLLRLILSSILVSMVWPPPSVADSSLPPVQITMYRPFGGCSHEYGESLDLDSAVGECGVIQVLTNRFRQQNAGNIALKVQNIQASSYYIRLSTSLASGSPPDIALMHLSQLPDFVSRGLLMPLDSAFAERGVDMEDFIPAARTRVTFDQKLYAVPFDLHALLWHLNLDILGSAGLVDPSGAPRMPASPEELLRHADLVKKRTGKRYIAMPSQIDPMPIWLFQSWTWQQGADFLDPDKKTETVLSPASINALTLLNELYDRGHIDRREDYSGAEYTFLQGKSAILINGTWVVDSFIKQTQAAGSNLRNYAAYTVPQIYQQQHSAWSDGHVWVIPKNKRRTAAQLEAAVSLLQFLYDHNLAWARTGHLPVRKSALQSSEFSRLPQRSNYRTTAAIARSFISVENQRAIESALGEEISSTWLIATPVTEALQAAAERIQIILARGEKRRRGRLSGASPGRNQ